MDINYKELKELVADTAAAQGTNPEEALDEFVRLVKAIKEDKWLGASQAPVLRNLSAMYGYYRKGTPYPPEQLLSEKELAREFALHKNIQKKANWRVSDNSRRANELLGDHYLKTNYHAKATGTGASATTNTSPEGGGDDV